MVKNPHANAGDASLISGSGRFPGEENGNPLQYSCQENPMDRGAWQATVHGVAKELDMTERLTLFTESDFLKRKLGPLFEFTFYFFPSFIEIWTYNIHMAKVSNVMI